MKKSKVFLLIAVIFLAIIFYVIHDMATKTTFPGRKDPKEKTNSLQDSIYQDTTKVEIKSDESVR